MATALPPAGMSAAPSASTGLAEDPQGTTPTAPDRPEAAASPAGPPAEVPSATTSDAAASVKGSVGGGAAERPKAEASSSRDRGRSRDRSRSERNHRQRRRSRDRGSSSRRRSPSYHRSSSRRVSRSRSGSRSRKPESDERASSRYARTVFVTQLQIKASEEDVKEFFESVCKVVSVALIRDKTSHKSKGFGYVELYS